MYSICAIYSMNDNKLNINVILLFFMSLCIIIFILFLEKKYKTVNNNLNDKEDLLHFLCSNVDDIFIVYDFLHHRFEYISPNFEAILGFSSSELRTNLYAILDHTYPEQRDDFIQILTYDNLAEFKELEFEYLHPIYQQKLWFAMRFYPVRKNNEIIRFITCIHEKTKEYNDREAIKEALNFANKANEAKKEFLSHISHELKTPINSIIGMSNIAANSVSDTVKVIDCLEKINYASNNLLTLINNILDIAKIDSDKLILINEPFVMLRTIEEFSSVISSQAEIKEVDYKLILHPVINECLVGDSLRITQILGNCLSNSIKFTPSGGLVTLEVWELEHTDIDSLYRFQVTDTGIGMNEDFINHIFDPFYQEHAMISTKYGGSGLGMSIAKMLLDLMGGTIHIKSKVEEGTVVTIDIRLKSANISTSASEKNAPFLKNAYNFSGMCVLVVDDNEINLEIVTEYLNSVNIKVETIMDGKAAIKRFEASEKGSYDMILMDVHMPDISGYEASRLIRSSFHPDSRKISIVAMTADNFVNNFSCIQSGINYHISKPIDPTKLYQLLNAIRLKEEKADK